MNKNFIKILFCLGLPVILFFTCSSYKTMKGMPDCIIVEPSNRTQQELSTEDTITIVATDRYKAGIIKPIFQGTNYRKAWETPIKVPVVSLSEIKGGIKPLEMGGGKQTMSMDLKGSHQVIYTLRSVNKNPEGLVPEVAKTLRIGNIVMDAMSAQHPYGALVVAPLADAVGILHTHPKLVYVPVQPALDTFNHKYGGHVFLLEYEPEGSGEWVNMEGVQKIVDTEDVQELLSENPETKIDERALVRARLFDLMIGDWDRHAKQWGWIVVERDSVTTYVPLPTDRDNVFYNPGGLIPWIVTRPMFQPLLRPFRKKIDHLPGMIKPFDQYFLLDVPESVFVEVAKELQEDLTDEEIEQSLRMWPNEFYDLDAKEIIKCIKARRADLPKYAKEFKQIVDKRGPLLEPLKGSSKLYVRK